MESKPASVALRHGCFFVLVALSVAVFHRALSVVIGSSLQVDRYSHILLVFPISVALLYLEHKKVFAKVGYSQVGVVAFVLLVGAFLYASTRWTGMSEGDSLSLSFLFFVGWCLSAFVLCYGTAAFRAGLFPLLFLVLMVPLPESLLHPTIAMLQSGSGDATCFLYRVAHVPYVRNGVMLSLPKVDIEIAEECSGIRSTLVLVLSSLVLGHLYLDSWWAKTLLTIAVLPVTVAKNGLRIFVLSTLGMYVDPSFLSGRLHHQGGFVFFILAIAVLILLIWLLQKLERGLKGTQPSPVPAR